MAVSSCRSELWSAYQLGVPSSAIRLYIGKLVVPLGALVSVTILMGDHAGKAIGNVVGRDVGKEVGSPDGPLVV